MANSKIETGNWKLTREGATLIEVLVALVILVVGIWAAIQIFGPGLVFKKSTAASETATRFAEGQRARLGELPVAFVARDPATGLVDFSVSPSPRSWGYLYQVRTVVGEKILASPYVFLCFGPTVRATQLAYFPEPYDPLPDPDPASIDLLPPRYYPDPLVPGPPTPESDSWQYTRRYTPATTYLAFDDYTVDGDDPPDAVNEPRWLLLNYSTLDPLTGGVSDFVSIVYAHPLDPTVSLPPTDLLDPATYTIILPADVIPGSESVFRIVGTSLFPPRSFPLPYLDDDPATPLVDESTLEGPGTFGFKFRAQDQGPGQVALPLPGETLLANYDFAGHTGSLDFGPAGSPSYQNVSLPDILWEDHLVPTSPALPEIHLDYKPPEGDSTLTDTCPSFVMAVVRESPATFDVILDPGPPPVTVPQSGRLFPDATPTVQDRVGPDASPLDIDLVDGRDSGLLFAPEIAGKWVRVYYRVPRSWTTHVVKSAAEYAVYIPDSDPLTPLLEPALGLPAIWDDSDPAPANHHWRVLFDDPAVAAAIRTPKQSWLIPSTDPVTSETTLSVPSGRQFYAQAEVAVDYIYDGDERASGEGHRIDPLPSGEWGFTLNHSNVNQIISIRGASAKIRVAWRTPISFYKLKTYDIRTDAVWRGSESD